MKNDDYKQIIEKLEKELIVNGNKFHFFSFAIVMFYIDFLFFVFLPKYIENEQKGIIVFTFLYFVSILSTLIINIKTKWRLKYIRYLYFGVFAVAGIMSMFNTYTYNYDDIIMALWLIPISVVYLDKKFVLINSVLSFIIIINCSIGLYEVSNALSLWFTFPIFINIVNTIVFTKISVIIKGIMCEKEIEEYKTTKSKIDLNLAGKIQKGLLKDKIEEEGIFEVKGYISPSKEIGGDFYDYYMLDDKRLVLLIADVSGKGLAAALFASYVKTVIYDFVINGISFEKSIEKANKSVYNNNKELEFVTIFTCVIDLSTGEMNYINAGHCAPIIMHKDGTTELLKSKPDFVFGVSKSKNYHSKKYKIEIGDKLVLYTDGITERFNDKKELYGKERFMQSISKNNNKNVDGLIEGILDDLNVYSKNTVQNDDITCVILDYQDILYVEKPLCEEFLIDENAHKNCISMIKEYLTEKSVPIDVINQMVVVTDEITSNIIKYAYEDNVKAEDKTFAISIKAVRNIIEISYSDKGKYFNPLAKVNLAGSNKVTEKSKIGGLGIQLVFNLMDDMEYERYADTNMLKIYKEY